MVKSAAVSVLAVLFAAQGSAQTWPDFYLTNGTHTTSYGVETYDPATVKNLYVNPTAILRPGGTELGNIYDGNQLILNGGTVESSLIDEDDFTWNSGTLSLNGGTHSTWYGHESGSGKTLNINSGATMNNVVLNSIPSGNQLNLNNQGTLSVGSFNASMAGFAFNGGTLEIAGLLTGLDAEMRGSDNSRRSLVLNGASASWDVGGRLLIHDEDGDTRHADNIVISGGASLVSDGANIERQLEVTGTGSNWDGGNISVGSNKNRAKLLISDGGVVESITGTIGYRIPWIHNQVGISGAGSQWKISDRLIIGGGEQSTSNHLFIENGGAVSSKHTLIGLSPMAADNAVYVTGAGSTWTNKGSLSIGDYYCCVNLENELNRVIISDGGELILYGDLTIVGRNWLNIEDGGKLTVCKDFDASMHGLNHLSGGTLAVEGQLSGVGTLESGRRLETPDLLGDLTVHGIFAPGTSPAGSLVDGDLTIASDGTLEMELGGYALGAEYDRLTVTGLTSLDGLLEIVSLGDFAPTNGAVFNLFDWEGGANGTFSAISTDALTTGQSWDATNLYTTGQLSVVPEPGSIGLLGLGSGILLFSRRHRRRKQRTTAATRWLAKEQHACDAFDPASETVTVHRRDFWDFLAECARVTVRTKAAVLRMFDAFLALVMK